MHVALVITVVIITVVGDTAAVDFVVVVVAYVELTEFVASDESPYRNG